MPLKPGRPANVSEQRTPAVEVVIGVCGKKLAVFYSELLTVIEQSLAGNGYDCIIRTFNGEYDQYLSLRETLKTSSARDTIITGYFEPSQLQGLLSVVPNALLLDNPGSSLLQIPYSFISFDNTEAARMGIRHLQANGHKRILLLNGFSEHYFSREIEQGYRDALSCADITVDENLIINSDFTADGAYEKISKALDDKMQFDAVFTNDEMACGVYRAVYERGLKIPEDIAICGCDGLPVGDIIFPKLTTIQLDYQKLGQMAVDFLERRRSGDVPGCRTKILPELNVKQSS
jgi:LacI family transcriptional regulator